MKKLSFVLLISVLLVSNFLLVCAAESTLKIDNEQVEYDSIKYSISSNKLLTGALICAIYDDNGSLTGVSIKKDISNENKWTIDSPIYCEKGTTKIMFFNSFDKMNPWSEIVSSNWVRPDKQTSPTLLYQGQASIRIVTSEGKVIYIDPYAGNGYDLPADLILVTHGHFDHNGLNKIRNRNNDCRIITQNEAIKYGEHQTFDLGYVKVEAVEAGFNSLHSVTNCVGYVLTFSNGKSVYVTGDTSMTEQMSRMKDMQIDYAFYCCDGVYNMGLDEAAKCAEMVGAKHNIPYHITAENDKTYDRSLAEKFNAPNRLIIDEGEEIKLD